MRPLLVVGLLLLLAAAVANPHPEKAQLLEKLEGDYAAAMQKMEEEANEIMEELRKMAPGQNSAQSIDSAMQHLTRTYEKTIAEFTARELTKKAVALMDTLEQARDPSHARLWLLKNNTFQPLMTQVSVQNSMRAARGISAFFVEQPYWKCGKRRAKRKDRCPARFISSTVDELLWRASQH